MNIAARACSRCASSRRSSEDLGNVEFLGTRVVKTHPELKSWGVGSPAKVPFDELITGRGKYNAAQRAQVCWHLPDHRRLQRRASRPAGTSIGKTRCSSTRSTRASASLRSAICRSRTGCTRSSQLKTLNWDVKLSAQWRRFLRPVRAGRAQPARRYGHRRLQQDDHLRSAAAARPVRVAALSTPASSGFRTHRTSPSPNNIEFGRDRRQIPQLPNSLWRGRSREGLRVARHRRPRLCAGQRLSQALRRGRLWRSRCHSRTARYGFMRHAGTAAGDAQQPAFRVLLRLVPQQLCR